jgi:hypothetical protein
MIKVITGVVIHKSILKIFLLKVLKIVQNDFLKKVFLGFSEKNNLDP